MGDDTDPRSIHSTEPARLTRRRVVKTLAAAGVATAGALTVEDVRAAASDEVPIALDVEGNSKTTVAADWYERLTTARKVRRAIDSQYLPEEPTGEASQAVQAAVVGVWLDAGTGRSEPHVIVSLDETAESLDEARGVIPEQKQGVPIRLEETEPAEELTCDPNQKSDTSDMPGGLAVNFYDEDGAQGTLTSRVYDSNNYTYKLMTAAHVPEAAANACGSSLEGLSAYHNGDKLGEVDFVDHTNDVAVIDAANTTPLDEVWNPEDLSERYTVKNTMSKDCVDLFMNEDRYLFKYGVGKCYGSGTISARGKKERAYYNENCTKYWRDCIRWGQFGSIGAGDSGSIAFGVDPDGSNYLASNINSWRWADYSAGPAGYAIDSNHGYYWS